MNLYLASCSPRRQELLRQIGESFGVIEIEVDESCLQGESARDYVGRLAVAKARAGAEQVVSDAPVLGSDTAVVLDDRVLGKAMTGAEARSMLEQLSGRCHHVYTGVAVYAGQFCRQAVSVSRVSIRPLSEQEISAYSGSEEALGKAGAYAIQGQAAAWIERLEGSYSGVMGLPLFETSELLRQLRAVSADTAPADH